MSDLISRQAAIDHLKKRLYETALNNNTEHPYYEEIADNRVDIWLNELPSSQPERLTDDDFETIRIHLNAYKEKLCNQHRWEEADEYQRIIDRFMAFASAQPDSKELSPTHKALDTISRQAAIDALDEIESEVADGNGYQYEKWRNYFCELPPAQPEKRTEERTETHACDLIDRQAAIDAVGSMLRRKFGIGGDLAEITLAGLPSAQPEITICIECVHYEPLGKEKAWGRCSVHSSPTENQRFVQSCDFCAWAERRTDD